MDQEIFLPANAEDFSPVFISAPSNHCGSAMLQRAFCTGENSICYGDNLFDEILSLIDWSVGLVERHAGQEEWEHTSLTHALNRTPEKWMPDLAPPSDVYSAALFSVVYNLPQLAQGYAEQQGRNVWLLARAGIASSRMGDLAAIFPKSKLIFIHRNPMDIARDTLRDRPDTNVREICDVWNASMREFLTYTTDRMLKLRYEDAVENTDSFISTLQDFTGATGLDSSVVTTGSEAESDSDYEMGDDLKTLVQSQCADMLAVYYPELVP